MNLAIAAETIGKENNVGGGQQQGKDWLKITTAIAAVVGVGGGAPYISSLQSELRQTREALIRLEEKSNSRDESWRRMEAEQQHLRELIEKLNQQLRDRKIVFRQAESGQPVVDGNLVNGK
jgi:uncharacterized protein HemX